MRSLIALLAVAATMIGPSPIKADTAKPALMQPAAKTVVRANAEVTTHLIKLGDLFTNIGDKAAIEVAYAPEPGKRAVFDARWLYRVARAYKINWRPLSDRVRTVITRQSQVIGRAEIEDMILEALEGKGADMNSEVELSNRLMRLHLPGDSLASLALEDVAFDPRSKRFTAVIAAPAGNGTSKRHRVRGRLFTTAEIPVLNRRMLAGEIIKADDLKWIKVRANRLQSNTIASETDLIGHTPRRGLRAGYPVLTSAVRRPILVEKNSLVTMMLRTPKMTLTAQGKALEAGSEGDVIRISNSQSKTVIEAEVVGDGRVAVRPTTLVAMN